MAVIALAWPCIAYSAASNIYLCFIKGQLKSEWIYEVIDYPKLQQKYCKDFCPEIPNFIFLCIW